MSPKLQLHILFLLFVTTLLIQTRGIAELLPANISIISEQEIRSSRTQNLAELLEQETNLSIVRTGALGSFSVLTTRGASPMNFLLNGEPLAGSSRQFLDISKIPTENIDHVEIIRGAASVIFGGDTSGGVVNIVTRKPKSDGTTTSDLGAQARSKGTQFELADFNRHGHRLGGGFSYGRFRTDGLQVNSYAQEDSFDGFLEYSLPHGGDLEVEGTIWDNKAGDPRGTPADISLWNGKNEQQPLSEFTHTEENTKTGRLVHKKRWSPKIFSQWSLFVLRREFQNIPSDMAAPHYESIDSLVNSQLEIYMPGGFVAGGSFQSDDQNVIDTSRSHDYHWNGFIINSQKFGPYAAISRLHIDQEGSYGMSIDPRLTLMITPVPWLTFSGNVGHSRRIPSFLERFYQLGNLNGNQNLIPEKTWDYDAGFQITASSATFRITGFYSRTEDRILQASTTFINSRLAEQLGMESEFNWAWKKIQHHTEVTVLNSRGQSTAQGFVPLKFSPTVSLSSTLTVRPTSLWTSWVRVRYKGDQYDQDNRQGILIPQHTVLDAELSRQIWNSEIYLRVENIANQHYAEGTGFDPRLFAAAPAATLAPQLSRSFWVGFIIHFTD